MSALILSEMTWPELDKVKDEIEIVLIPVGSCEQHGHSMTYATDAARAYEYSKLIGERMGHRALVCPPINYGISYHHMCFPGTITLQPETLLSIVCDICVSLKKHGFQKFAFMNAHGGNNAILDVAVNKLKGEYGIDAFFSPVGGRIFNDAVEEEWGWSNPRMRGHGCESEGSQALAICPWVVRDERIPGDMYEDAIQYQDDNPFQYGGTWAYNWKQDWTRNGCLGDIRKASEEAGRKCNELSMDRMMKMIEFFIQRNVD